MTQCISLSLSLYAIPAHLSNHTPTLTSDAAPPASASSCDRYSLYSLHSLYLLYWYKSTNTDAAASVSGGDDQKKKSLVFARACRQAAKW